MEYVGNVQITESVSLLTKLYLRKNFPIKQTFSKIYFKIFKIPVIQIRTFFLIFFFFEGEGCGVEGRSCLIFSGEVKSSEFLI